jgi:quercetin dioxygenase-like cupin family protein
MVILDAEGFARDRSEVHLTKLCEARPERAAGWGTQPLTDLSWLIDADLGDSERGAVARMTIEAGGGQEPHRHPGSEEVALVLEGAGNALVDGGWQPIEAGNLLHAPMGSVHALAAGPEGLDLRVVLSATSAAAAGWEPHDEATLPTTNVDEVGRVASSHGAPPAAGEPSARTTPADTASPATTAAVEVAGEAVSRVLTGHETEEIELDDPAIGFIGMNARWLATDEICATGSIVVGASRFAAEGGVHELHRHPEAAEFFIVLSGEGVQLDEDGAEVPVEVGEAALLPRGGWHGFRNTGQEEVRAVFGFLGATSLDRAGYELAALARSAS